MVVGDGRAGAPRLAAGIRLDAVSHRPLLFGVVLLVLFVRRQRRRTHPLVDLKLFARPAFSISVGCIVLALLALVGLELIAAQYLQLVLGLTPLETGLRLLPLTFAAMAAGLVGSRMLQWLGPRVMVAIGFALTALAVLSLTAMGQSDRPAVLVGGFIVLGFGLETTLFSAYESMLNEASVNSAGGAAAIGENLVPARRRYRHSPPRQRDERHLQARRLLGVRRPRLGQLRREPVAGRRVQGLRPLGGHAGEALRSAARGAFVHGLHVTLAVSAGLLLVGALAALRLPKAMECAADDEEPPRAPTSAHRAVRTPRPGATAPPSSPSPDRPRPGPARLSSTSPARAPLRPARVRLRTCPRAARSGGEVCAGLDVRGYPAIASDRPHDHLGRPGQGRRPGDRYPPATRTRIDSEAATHVRWHPAGRSIRVTRWARRPARPGGPGRSAATVREWAADRVAAALSRSGSSAGRCPGSGSSARELGGPGALGTSLSGYGCAGRERRCSTGWPVWSWDRPPTPGSGRWCRCRAPSSMYAIHRFGSEEQKQEWLPRMAAGEVIGCFGLTEPDHGSDPAGMRTYAERDGA
ncbi:hypothetical protein SANTM175S_06807 [Streptomyces antimycoticus]